MCRRWCYVLPVWLAALGVASAHPGGLSIGINFGADEPPGVRSDVNGAAGVLGTVNWNNLDLAAGGPVQVAADNGGASEAGVVEVTWTSNNTWSSTGRGEEHNVAPDGDDRNLMTGYLDTTATSVTQITVTNLDELSDDPYTVYVYMNGGVPGRGGTYTIGAESQDAVDNQAFNGEYVPSDDLLVFENVSGASFTLEAMATTQALLRAPVNAIEIVFGEGVEIIFPQRSASLAVPPEECAPNGRGPVTVGISQALGKGLDPNEQVTVTEEVRGSFSAAQVMAMQGGVVTDLPQDPIAPVGAFGDHRDIITNPVCEFGNGSTIEGPAGVYTMTAVGEDVWTGGDTFQFAYNIMRGDFDVQVRIADRTPAIASRWGKHGIMARQSLIPRSRYTTTQDAIGDVGQFTGAPHNNDDSTMQAGRRTHGGADNFENQPFPVNPSGDGIDDYCDGVGPDDGTCTVVHHDYLRMERVGNVFNSYSRADPADDWVLLGSHDWGNDAPQDVRVGIYATSHSTNCDSPIEIVFDEWTVNSGETVEATLDGIGASIEWTVTRQQLADGLEYTVDVEEGDIAMSGEADGKTIAGPQSVTLSCDTQITNLTCVRNAEGNADLSWTNHPFADTAVDISIAVDGAEVDTVSGMTSSTTIAADQFPESGYAQICVTNSSGTPVCCTFLRNGINVGDLVAGGDGNGSSDPSVVGINADLGILETQHLNQGIGNTGDALQLVDPGVAPAVDSVFILDQQLMAINSELGTFEFGVGDATGGTYNHIIRDVTHDIDKNPPITDIWAGGVNDWKACVAIHAAAGVTFDLEVLGMTHGELQTFSCFAGVDQCNGFVTLYAIQSDDEGVVLDSVFVDGLGANTGEPMEMDLLPGAKFLTLAVGANDGSIGCAHGVFADPVISTGGGGGGPTFIRGDTNADGGKNIADPVYLLNNLFGGGPNCPCREACDINDDGGINIADPVYLLNNLFGGGPDVPPPGPDCGPDPNNLTPVFECASFPPCP